MKLSRAEINAHNEAVVLVKSDRRLDWDERKAIIDNWHEGAEHMNSAAGAFFTPHEMAFHVGVFAPHGRVLDLCSGIGSLSFGVETHNGEGCNDFTLVELNPEYAAVAKRVMPDAEVITGSIYDEGLLRELRQRNFDCVISNPPFGTQGKPKGMSSPRFTGGMQFEIVDIASDMAPYGIFILSQEDCPFEYSGKRNHTYRESSKARAFREATHINLQCVSVDTSGMPRFRNTPITVEICSCDFENDVWPMRAPAQASLFGDAA